MQMQPSLSEIMQGWEIKLFTESGMKSILQLAKLLAQSKRSLTTFAFRSFNYVDEYNNSQEYNSVHLIPETDIVGALGLLFDNNYQCDPPRVVLSAYLRVQGTFSRFTRLLPRDVICFSMHNMPSGGPKINLAFRVDENETRDLVALFDRFTSEALKEHGISKTDQDIPRLHDGVSLRVPDGVGLVSSVMAALVSESAHLRTMSVVSLIGNERDVDLIPSDRSRVGQLVSALQNTDIPSDKQMYFHSSIRSRRYLEVTLASRPGSLEKFCRYMVQNNVHTDSMFIISERTDSLTLYSASDPVRAWNATTAPNEHIALPPHIDTANPYAVWNHLNPNYQYQ